MNGGGLGPALWVVLAAGFFLASAAEAGVYQFRDENGTVHYTNVPTHPRYHLLQRWQPSPDPPAGSPSRAAASRTPWPARFAEVIQAAVERHRVDRRLVEAVIAVESAGNPQALSPKGAQGLMQLMPQRSAALGVQNPFDPRQNVDGGVRHLRELLDRFAGDVTLALAAYNAGEGAVATHRGVPPYPETQDYVRKVRALYDGPSLLGGARLAVPAVMTAPQWIYQLVADDGTVTFTNVPPGRGAALRRPF